MGKKYYCDYCDKRIQRDPNIVRKHNEGLPHFRAKSEHYIRFKAIEQILQEERTKFLCRSLRDGSECSFGVALCRYSHYTSQQIQQMQMQVKQKEAAEQRATKEYDRRLDNAELWVQSYLQQRSQRMGKKCSPEANTNTPLCPHDLHERYFDLPPSLQAVDHNVLQDCKTISWG